MNRRVFLQSSGAALTLLAIGKRAAAADSKPAVNRKLADENALKPGAITPGMRAHRAERLAYNNPGLHADLGVGLWAWPLPMDVNGDGLMDLVVVGSGVPSNGTYIFENTGLVNPDDHTPIFKPGVRVGRGIDSPQVSYVNGKPMILGTTSPNPGPSVPAAFPDFLHTGMDRPQPIPASGVDKIHPSANPALSKTNIGGIRSSQWTYVDYYGTGKVDLIVGIDYWGDYNWLNVNHGTNESAYTPDGKWKYGPLRGFVYLLKNTGTNEAPVYADPVKLEAAGAPIEVYGRPSPMFADFRRTGKLDLICGSFMDDFTYFENIGTRTEPKYAPGRKLASGGVPILMDLCMIAPAACDFYGDGRIHLIVGDEDGRVAFIENTGNVEGGMPQFLPPRYLRQVADELKFGVLASPSACDLDGDGIEDLVAGNDAGYIGFIKNLGGYPPRWAEPEYIAGGGKLIHIQAGYNGDCQGPSEVKWGYVNVCAADWDGDGLIDLVCSDVWGKTYWYRNVGTRTQPKFAAAEALEVEWDGPPPKPAWNWWNPGPKELVLQWRCTPYVIDWNKDGLPDLISVDHEGYLALFERRRLPGGKLVLLPGKRVFWGEGVSSFDSRGAPLNNESGLLRMNGNLNGASGRRTFCFTDWDGDGELDLLVNSVNINFLKGMGRNKDGLWVFKDMGPLTDQRLAGHSTCPTIVHWGPRADGDLLFSTEDGFMYHLRRPV